MTSPADKATDDVRGLVERLKGPRTLNDDGLILVHPDFFTKAAATLTSLLERAERAERRAEELADGLMYVTVDHTGCIYTTADEDRAIKLAKDNLAAAIQAERTARERAEARIKELEQALGTAAVDLDEAAEEIEAWGAYASDYFQTKHDLDGCVKDVRDAARRARSMKGGEG